MKRKRYIYYDSNESDLKKRRKTASEVENIPFINEFPDKLSIFNPKEVKFEQIEKGGVDPETHFILPKTYEKQEVVQSYFLPHTPEKRKKVGFSSINSNHDIKEVFGVSRNFLPEWNIVFPKNLDYLAEYAQRSQKNFEILKKSWVGNKESDHRVYINDVVNQTVFYASTQVEEKIIVVTEEKHSGDDAEGDLDYVIKRKETIVVVLEAKKNDLFESEGVPLLLMQLKAVQEEEGKKDQWYYGFAATKDFWTPCRLNMKHKDMVQIGQKLTIAVEDINTFSRVLYVMESMILGKFDPI